MWGVSFFFLDGSSVSVPFMLLIHAGACSCKISISERGDFYILFLFFFFLIRRSNFKKLSRSFASFPLQQLFRRLSESQGTPHL